VDPEALILASLATADDEPRGVDLAAHWSLLNSDLLSVQRTRTMVASFPAAARYLPALARELRDLGADARWGSLVSDDAEPLVYRRGRGRAVRVPLERLPCVMLRLRVLFGVSIKADAVTYLLAADGYVDPREIARNIAYGSAPVRRVLHALAEAGWLHETLGSRTGYSIGDLPLRNLLGVPRAKTPAWAHCAGLFATVIAFLEWVRALPAEPGKVALAIHLGKFATAHRATFVDIGLLPPYVESPAAPACIGILSQTAAFLREKV